ncbi:hypothetical protein [Streptomyces olivochromogenes]|uniref:Uncharacterized protein n=1 Tax=Streptomyces olivochromogenes TaxID=1963 RepID=A0A250V4R2_STROL|nr:hypothetical protein [Streptomyces olivochromogenes]KUN49461.1 hypothetical protein AQJ27_02825 [Streptomyces olivochromogenes]GAX49145.1 hypothetical protein SO3561_00633 [Streptomyces olivochromogenes]
MEFSGFGSSVPLIGTVLHRLELLAEQSLQLADGTDGRHARFVLAADPCRLCATVVCHTSLPRPVYVVSTHVVSTNRQRESCVRL